MKRISYKRHRFPPDIIQFAVWTYFRFTMSLRDVEDLLADRGIDVSYETVRCWAAKFGPQITRRLRRKRPKLTGTWHLDEMFVMIGGKSMYLWRAVDSEGEVLDMLVQESRDVAAALKLMRKLLRNQRMVPEMVVTERLKSYGAALRGLGLEDRHRPGRLWLAPIEVVRSGVWLCAIRRTDL